MSDSSSIKLKKAAEGEVHGPMEMRELIELCQAAFIAPEDEVAFGEEDWKPAHEVSELEMNWVIKTGEGIEYGPTSSGTIREFLMVGEISEETLVYHKETKEEKSVEDLLGESAMSEVKEEQKQVKEDQEETEDADDVSEALDVAKDIRIQQLETDLKDMETKYNSLMLKFRKVSEELTTLKQK